MSPRPVQARPDLHPGRGNLRAQLAVICISFSFLSGPIAPAGLAQAQRKSGAAKNHAVKLAPAIRPAVVLPSAPLGPQDEAVRNELARLARALREPAPGAYDNVSAFAGRHASDAWGARAALALGYADYTRNRAPQAAAWLERAQSDPLLKEYALFWRAQTRRALHREADALADFQALRRDDPNSVISEQVVAALAETAVSLGKPVEAVAALDAYPYTLSRPALLFERARARQAAGSYLRAANDYQSLYDRFPLSDEAHSTASILAQLAKRLGKEFPRATPDQQEARAQAFFDARKWREAQSEFGKLLAMIGKKSPSAARQRAQLRVAQARIQAGASPALLASMALGDADLDAERLYSLSQAWRSKKREREMLAALELLAKKYPDGRWNEDGVFTAGNYFWVQLDRERAASYYQQLLAKFPAGKYSQTAEWRIAWVSYLNRRPEAPQILEAFVRKYPDGSYAENALYWLGRAAERAGSAAHARGFYLKLEERFTQTYFGGAAKARLAAIGREPANPAGFLERMPPPAPLHNLDEPVPAAAAVRWARAQALRTIGFDASAELELRAAYFSTGSPRLIFEAAQAALDQGHYNVAMALTRLAILNFESRKKDDVPLDAWKTLFPLPYETAVRHEAARNALDPMLVAGLIRQESTFQAGAVSRAGAVGLMQVLPKTARKLARRLKLRYARTKLSDPEYNLKLGTLYLADLLRLENSPEAALGAFNAGEDRVAAWQAERKYEEPAEFVESVPFTETREYIQIVLRNAQVYRMIYGETGRQP